MYLKQGFTPIHVLSDIHGNKHKTIDRHTRNLIERAGWKELRDKGGRKYDPRSIRKWHINHAIELGEHRADIAERVGTSYAVICADYADNDFVPSTRPDSFDSVLNPIEKVLYLA
jgi:transposase